MADREDADCNSETGVRPIRKVLFISAGASHSVALLSGNVVCSWGRGEDGQLGLGDAEDRFSPTQVSTLDGQEIVSVICGADHTTAYSEGFKQVYSWGWLGQFDWTSSKDVSRPDFSDHDGTYYPTTGNVVCSWGRGEDGQLGLGDAEDRFSPTQVSTLDGQEIVSVICGADHTTAYSEGFKQVYSWGWGDFGRLGHGNSSDLFTPQPIKALQGIRIKQIACGDSHCLAVTMEGEVQSWGRNQNGQLGLGTTEDSLVPRKIDAFKGIPVKMVAAGAEHTAAVTEDGELYGWGWGRYGNLGLGDRNDRLVPEKVSDNVGEKMFMVACGWRHTISVSSSGALYTYGWSKYGQLGHGDFEDHLFPHKVQALHESFTSQISGGWRHTMALSADGKLYGWGWNKFGQVGVDDNCDHCSPVQVKFPHDQKVILISCGWRHTLAVTERQNVFSWGRGTNGQLGHGESVDRYIPRIIEVLSADGSSGQQIGSSTFDPSAAEKSWVSPTERYAVVPDENVPRQTTSSVRGSGNDVNVPENDVKRIRV